LLSKNKLLTRDNLERRKNLDDPTCLFGSEKESVHHIFGCVVPNRVWEVVSQVIGVQTGWDFESVARLGFIIKNLVLPMLSLQSVLEHLEAKECYFFQGVTWLGMKMVWQRVLSLLRCWKILIPLRMATGFDDAITVLEKTVLKPEQLRWVQPGAPDAGHDPGGARQVVPVRFQPP
jgi:hypothetical protein